MSEALGNFRAGAVVGIGIVYDKTGAPRLEQDFLDNLTPQMRDAVQADLKKHGWRLTADDKAERI